MEVEIQKAGEMENSLKVIESKINLINPEPVLHGLIRRRCGDRYVSKRIYAEKKRLEKEREKEHREACKMEDSLNVTESKINLTNPKPALHRIIKRCGTERSSMKKPAKIEEKQIQEAGETEDSLKVIESKINLITPKPALRRIRRCRTRWTSKKKSTKPKEVEINKAMEMKDSLKDIKPKINLTTLKPDLHGIICSKKYYPRKKLAKEELKAEKEIKEEVKIEDSLEILEPKINLTIPKPALHGIKCGSKYYPRKKHIIKDELQEENKEDLDDIVLSLRIKKKEEEKIKDTVEMENSLEVMGPKIDQTIPEPMSFSLIRRCGMRYRSKKKSIKKEEVEIKEAMKKKDSLEVIEPEDLDDIVLSLRVKKKKEEKIKADEIKDSSEVIGPEIDRATPKPGLSRLIWRCGTKNR